MRENFQCIYKADGLLFLLEPMQIKFLQPEVLRANPYLKDQNPDDLQEVFYNVLDLMIHTQRNRKKRAPVLVDTTPWWKGVFVKKIEREKINCPIAIGVTKIDQLKHLMLNEIPYDNEDFDTMYLKGGHFNMDLVHDISRELKDLIFDVEKGELGVENLLAADVAYYELFGIKSGNVDDKEGAIVSMNYPQGVLLPLIWLILKLKLY